VYHKNICYDVSIRILNLLKLRAKNMEKEHIEMRTKRDFGRAEQGVLGGLNKLLWGEKWYITDSYIISSCVNMHKT